MKRKIGLLLVMICLVVPNTIAFAASESTTTSSSSTDETGKTTPSLTEDPLSTMFSSEVTDNSTSVAKSEKPKETKEITESSTTEESEISRNEKKGTSVRAAAQLLDAHEVAVGDWATFVKSIEDETVTKIRLTSSFNCPSSGDPTTPVPLISYLRKSNLEIDGQGHRVDFANTHIMLGYPTNSTGLFYMHDIVLAQGILGAEEVVGTGADYATGAKWRYRFGNIKTEPTVQRLARATNSEVTVYGKMDIDTRAENFYLGSFIMEDNTVYNGNVNYYDYSLFYYNAIVSNDGTASSNEYTIGKNCRVNLTQSQTAGTAFPAVYLYYRILTVGENSVFNVNMPGNAVRFEMVGSGMVVKSGAVVNLTSKQPSGSVVAFATNNSYLLADPGAYFYVIGHSNQPLINMASNGNGTGVIDFTNNRFVLDSPAQYDIRNLQDGIQAVRVAADSAKGASNSFKITNTDIDLWKLSTQALGPSDEYYTKVNSFEVTGYGVNQKVDTSDPGLSGFVQNNYRRISGMNQTPTLEWTPITDADKTLQARVIIGMVPDNNGMDKDGNINYIPVYASKDQGRVAITDSYGTQLNDVYTDQNGYISYHSNTFQKAGKQVSAITYRGSWSSYESVATTVIDVTPPEPAKVNDAMKIESITPQISGTGEPESIVTVTVNGQEASGLSSTVASDGSWKLDISSLHLKQNDVLQIFLRDQSGPADGIDDPPDTNNEIGNIEPAKDMKYRDATFKAATTITIVGYLSLREVPDQFNFGLNDISNKTETYQPQVSGRLEISDSRSGARKPWRITVNQSEELKLGTISLVDSLYYRSQLGELPINTKDQVIETGEFTKDGIQDISSEWQSSGGFKLVVPPEKQHVGTYSGKLSWKLEDVPKN